MQEKLAFYFRGPTVGPDVPGAFISDAKVLLDLSLEDIRSIADELVRYPGFLADGMLDEIISHVLGDRQGDVAARLARLIRYGELFLKEQEGLDALFSRLEKWRRNERKHESGNEPLTDGQWDQIKQRLPLILRKYPGRLRQQKADRLAEATGLRAESVDLICDLRPVLDESRSQITGLIPLTTLRIVASGVDQFPITFEATLSAKNVQELLRASESAVKKLNTLGEFAAKNQINIPAVGLTETIDTSGDDNA